MKLQDYLLLILSLLLFIPTLAKAQEIEKIVIGINGLTCSQCSKSVEMQLQKISFVSKIDMDLAGTEATITVKSKGNLLLHHIPKAIKDAGFSIRSLDIFFTEAPFVDIECWTWRGNKLGTPTSSIQKAFRIWEASMSSRSIFKNHQFNFPSCCDDCLLLVPLKDWK